MNKQKNNKKIGILDWLIFFAVIVMFIMVYIPQSIWIEEDGNIGLQIQKKFQNIGIGIIAFQKIQELHHKDIYKTTVCPKNKDSINISK